VPPYSDWTTAAKRIQDAVDAAAPGDTVLVTNGVYDSGGRITDGTLTNRVVITGAIMLQSVNGPSYTSIHGVYSAFPSIPDVRCMYLSGGAVVSGFWISNGGTPTGVTTGPDSSGCGIWCPDGNCFVSNCVIYANQGSVAAVAGGTLDHCIISTNMCSGATGCLLNNCLIYRNTSSGAVSSSLNNSTVSANVTSWTSPAAGILYCSATNCLIVYNPSAAANNGNYLGSYLEYCCTAPMPATGRGNITNPPGTISTLNLRLTSTSPCINAGENTAALPAIDLDWNPRVAGGTVDIGAYEYQAPASRISYSWLQYYRFKTDGSADFTDPDQDGMNNWQEWRCGTDPTNRASVLSLQSVQVSPSGVAVTWQSVSNRTYTVERAGDFTSPSPFTPFATGIAGQPSTTTFIDPGAVGWDGAFYRVWVEP
jgi:hypothetical protein